VNLIVNLLIVNINNSLARLMVLKRRIAACKTCERVGDVREEELRRTLNQCLLVTSFREKATATWLNGSNKYIK
jgi:hypothetical protein